MEKFIDGLKKVWAVVAAVIGAVTSIAAFIQLWQGQRDTILWIIEIASLLIIILFLVFIGFSKKQATVLVIGSKPSYLDRYPQFKNSARVLLVLTLVLGVIGITQIYQRNKQLDEKVVILLTAYDGPDPKAYRVNEIIYKQLDKTIAPLTNTEILTSDVSIPEQDGSRTARMLGQKYHADLVVWGWYAVTVTNVLVTTHIENINPTVLIEIPVSDDITVEGTITQINDFSIQQTLSDQMTALTLYVEGMSRYKAKDYDAALDLLEKVKTLGLPEENRENLQSLYVSLGNIYLQNNYDDQNTQKAEDYFQKALEIAEQSKLGDDARIYLGLAQVYYRMALVPFRDSTVRKDIDIDLLQKANDSLFRALDAEYQPEGFNIKENIYFSRGQTIFMCAYAGSDTCDLKDAIDSFEKVIASYDAGNHEIKELAGESHARLGLIYVFSGNISSAAEEYQKASELIDDPERKSMYQEKAQSFTK